MNLWKIPSTYYTNYYSLDFGAIRKIVTHNDVIQYSCRVFIPDLFLQLQSMKIKSWIFSIKIKKNDLKTNTPCSWSLSLFIFFSFFEFQLIAPYKKHVFKCMCAWRQIFLVQLKKNCTQNSFATVRNVLYIFIHF